MVRAMGRGRVTPRGALAFFRWPPFYARFGAFFFLLLLFLLLFLLFDIVNV